MLKNYQQRNSFIDFKIVIGLLATLPPIYTHFGPYRYPANYNIGVATTAFYFALSLLYYLHDVYMGTGTFFQGWFEADKD